MSRGAAPKTRSLEDSDDEPEQLQFKVIILGDGAVGKTSIASRFTEDRFAQAYKQTIGLDFFVKRLVLPGNVHVALQLWDIGGQSIGGQMIGNYIHGADAVVLCYDITNYQSFQDLEDWFRLVRRSFAQDRMPQLLLLGNKIDLNYIRAVTIAKHEAFADENSMSSSFVSAKTGDNIDSSFFRIAADLAGVVLSTREEEVATKVVHAQIVHHPEEEAASGRSAAKGNCVVQ